MTMLRLVLALSHVFGCAANKTLTNSHDVFSQMKMINGVFTLPMPPEPGNPLIVYQGGSVSSGCLPALYTAKF